MSEATMSREDEIRARVEKATPGPWELGGPYPSVSVIYCTDFGSTHPEFAEPPRFEPVAMLHQSGDYAEGTPPQQALDDADFIAHAREDVPYLQDELKKARAEVERLRRENERLAQANASALADTERMDWLEGVADYVDMIVDGDHASLYQYYNSEKTLREAIDERRKA